MAAAAKKRRPEEEEAAGTEEEMHLAFRGAANALSQVYGQAVAAQEKSFRAGERRAMENVYRWICSKHQEGLEVSVADLVAFLQVICVCGSNPCLMLLFYTQTEIEHRAGEVPGSLQHTSAQPACQFPSANVQSNSFSFGNVTDALNSHTAQTGQTQTAGVLNAPPNPLRQNLHSNHHPIHCSAYGTINSLPDGIGAQSNHPPQHQNFMHCNSYEPSMDES
uniref:Holocarboxylase synthetase n=1 Tax=Oryza meridionalis TaxID=40149 RepID=A0A0E0BY90_9ORYZ